MHTNFQTKNSRIRKLTLLLLVFAAINTFAAPPKPLVRFKKATVLCKNLPLKINESSGLVKAGKKLFTLNDSGDSARLYVLDTNTFAVLQVIKVTNAVNIDWEELTADSQYLYIGDIGNNFGTRNAFSIYRIPIVSIPLTGNASVTCLKTDFYYTHFTANTHSKSLSDYDAEAFMVLHDTIVLFSKSWQSGICDVYIFPFGVPNQGITPVSSFVFNGLVTGATFNQQTKQLFLVGYYDFCPFLLTVGAFSLQRPVVARKRLKLLLQYYFNQTEAICINSPSQVLVSSEYNRFQSGKIIAIETLP